MNKRMKIDLSETKPVYGLLIWYEEPERPYQEYKQFDDKDKAIEAYNKIVCDYKILVEHNGDDGDVLLEYSRGDDE